MGAPIPFADAIGGKSRVIGGPFGSNLTQQDYVPIGVPVIRGSNMASGKAIGGDFAFVSEAKFQRNLTSNAALPGDIIVTQRGTLGQVAILGFETPYTRYVVSQSQMAVRVDPKCADREFVYYYLTSKDFLDYISVATIQTGVPHINLGILRDAPVNWPRVERQREIAATLTALDDKIELNRRMNATLERQARALFRDWFVDFGPTRAKQARAPSTLGAYLAPHLWSLFPSTLDAEGKPEGWEWSIIGEEVDAVGGSTPSTAKDAYWDGDIAWTTPKDLSGLNSLALLDTGRRITAAGLATVSSGLLPVGTVLMSSRAPVGYLAVNQIPVAINQGYIAMKCTGRISNWFAYIWAKENMEAILQNANGSTFQEISKRNFRPLPVLVASDGVCAAFDDTVGPMFERIIANDIESRTLAQTRDLLLPKLMSGEIRVLEAQKFVEAVE